MVDRSGSVSGTVVTTLSYGGDVELESYIHSDEVENLFVGDEGRDIKLDVGESLVYAVDPSISVRKPDGTKTTWDADIVADTQFIKHTLVTDDLDQVGTYWLEAIVMINGNFYRGDRVSTKVESKLS